MTSVRSLKIVAAAVALVVVAVLVGTRLVSDDGRRITVYFPSAAALYVGNPVEVLGVPVGSVESVTPEAGRVKVVLELDDDVKLPADVHALQVAPSLISGRSIELAPVYSGGAELADDAVIPQERAEVPLDVNDLYTSAQDLSTALGPDGANENGALSRALDVLAENLDGNGESFAAAIRELAGASGTLAGARDDLTGTVRGLQTFTTTLADNDDAVRLLSRQLATVSGFLATDRTELGAALRQLSVSLGEVATFVRDNRDGLRRNVTQLTKVTRVLVKNRKVLGGILDEAPTGLGNLLASYDAAGGTLDVRPVLNELALGPGALVCELINRSAPTQVPEALLDLCSPLGEAIDGLGIPTVAELLAALQGSAPKLPLPSRGGNR